MEKKLGLGIAAILLLGILAVGVLAIGANGGLGNGFFFGKNTAIQSAVAADDYNAYLQAANGTNSTGKHKVVLNQDQFNQLAQKYHDNKPIIDAQQQISQAIKNNDYTAWAAGENALLDAKRAQITQDNFNTIVQQYQDMQNRTMTGPHFGRGFGKGRMG